jgi:uncharacterized peroxidase-related enzyme
MVALSFYGAGKKLSMPWPLLSIAFASRSVHLCTVNNDKTQKQKNMTRLHALSPEEATGKTAELFNAIKSKFGIVPNMMRTMGQSPALLEAYLQFSAALDKGSLGARVNKLIALAVAESNACDYCLSVHTYLGANLLKIDAESLEAAREGNSTDPRTAAILAFAKTLVKKRGRVSDEDLEPLFAAGLTEGAIGEVVGQVALNTLTNYFNNTANTEIDFPLVSAQAALPA